MTIKLNKDGTRALKNQEQDCIPCSGAGILHNRICKHCNGHGVINVYNDGEFLHVSEYAPTKEQLRAMDTLGGVA